MAIDGSELRQAQRQLAIAPWPGLVHHAVMRAIHRLDEEPLVPPFPFGQDSDTLFRWLTSREQLPQFVKNRLVQPLHTGGVNQSSFILGRESPRFQPLLPIVNQLTRGMTEQRRKLAVAVVREMPARLIKLHAAQVRTVDWL